MEEERICLKCKHLGSFTSPCPKKDMEILFKARNWASELPGLILNGKDFESLKEIALNCELFEIKIKRR